MRIQAEDLFSRVLVRQALDQVDLGADRPCRTLGSFLHRADDELRGAVQIARLHHLEFTLGMDQDVHTGHLCPRFFDLRHREPLVDAAVPLPQNELGGAQLLRRVSAERFERIPNAHVGIGIKPQLHARVPTQMLVWEEQHTLPVLQSPFHGDGRVGRRADGAVVLADEALQVRRRVDVGHWHHSIGKPERLELLPATANLEQVRHVRHAAACSEVRQDDALVRQNVGALRHEMDAAENDRLGFGPRAGLNAQLVAVAPKVGMLDNLVPLVMVAKDDQARTQFGFRRLDALTKFVGFEGRVRLGKGLLNHQL